MRKIILASASPRRKELLERAGVDFEVLPASGDENRISDNPGEAVKQLASDKAASVIRTMKDSADGTIVIGSDTVVVFENVILGKPHDTEDAVCEYIKETSGKYSSGIYRRFCMGKERKSLDRTYFL